MKIETSPSCGCSSSANPSCLVPSMSNELESSINKMIEVAHRATECGDWNTAEWYYNEAVRRAENQYGPDDPRVGLILLDLLDVYDAQQNRVAGARVFNRIRQIVLFCTMPTSVLYSFRRQH